MRSICSEAGLTERYFYESFANSEDLLCVVYEHVNQRIRFVRWIDMAARRPRTQGEHRAILEAIAAWILHIRGNKIIVDDPMRDTFKALWQTSGEAHIASALFGNDGQFAQYWKASEEDLMLVNRALNTRNR